MLSQLYFSQLNLLFCDNSYSFLLFFMVLTFEELDEWVSKSYNNYKLARYGSSIDVVLMGEWHNDVFCQRDQLRLLRIIKPKYLLHEDLMCWKYSPVSGIFRLQSSRLWPTIEDEDLLCSNPELALTRKFVGAADELGFAIVGCDLTCVEIGKKCESSFNYWQTDPVHRYGMAVRNDFMAEMILRFGRKECGCIPVIVGNTHASAIHNRRLLTKQGVGYVYIDQTNQS